MSISDLIDQYAGGPQLVRNALAGMTPGQLDARPIAGQWSTRQVVCHLADFEVVFVDRMKHVIAEENPPFRAGFHQLFAEHLCYDRRDVDEELAVIEAVRKQMARLLRALPAEAFSRTGVHSVDGPTTLQGLLERITGHIVHHVRFIEEKRRALA